MALEALLAELPDAAALGEHRAAVGEAANAALRGRARPRGPCRARRCGERDAGGAAPAPEIR